DLFLIVRVFNLKVRALVQDVYDSNMFGRAMCYNYTVDFQKRVIPHTHILMTITDDSQIRTADDVNFFIRSNNSGKESEPELYDLVTKAMVHRPCGERISESM